MQTVVDIGLRFCDSRTSCASDRPTRRPNSSGSSPRLSCPSRSATLTCTAFVPRTTSVGLPVGGKFKITEIGTEHLVREALTWGIPDRRSQQVVADAIEHLRCRLQAGSLGAQWTTTARGDETTSRSLPSARRDDRQPWEGRHT